MLPRQRGNVRLDNPHMLNAILYVAATFVTSSGSTTLRVG